MPVTPPSKISKETRHSILPLPFPYLSLIHSEVCTRTRSRFLLTRQCLLDFRSSCAFLWCACLAAHPVPLKNPLPCLWCSKSPANILISSCSCLIASGLAALVPQHSATAFSRRSFSESCFSSTMPIQIKTGKSLCIKFSVKMPNKTCGFYMINRAARTCLRFNFLIVKV